MKPRVDRLTSLFATLLICLIVASPLNNSYEILAMMNGTLSSSAAALGVTAWSVTLTPVYVRMLKDVFLILTALLALLRCLKSPSRLKLILSRPFVPLNIFAALIIFSALVSFTFTPATIVLMGVRGYWSILLVYAGALFCNLEQGSIYPYFTAIFALQMVLQVIQFVNDSGYPVYFEHRSPGLFIIPSTAGAFAVLSHYFGIRFKSTLLKSASLASLLLSNSTTGLLCLVVYYAYAYRNRFKPKFIYYPIFLIALIVLSYALAINLGTLTGRGGGSSYSLLVRLGLIYAVFSNWTSLLLGQGMGVATSQAFLSGYSKAVIADNTYLGIVYNAGITPAIVMLIFVVGSYRYFSNKLLYFIFLTYSMTTVIFELNPVVQILLIFLGMDIGRKYSAARIAPPTGCPPSVDAVL